MPKVVDHDERRVRIAHALLDVVRRDGVGAVSVRSVAAAADLSTGSLRNTFPSRAGLVGFAMTAVAERVTARVEARAAQGATDVEGLTDLCCEVLPLDAERLAEAEVWMELVVLGRTDAALRERSVATHEALGRFCAGVVTHLRPGPVRDVASDAAGLHAMLDGLALHAVLHPDRFDTGRAREAVRDHLAALARGRG
ncbi:TetR family transcriptional regulator C-terminal domain-containing protein [Phycicoccus sp. CSK15P-2]|uniref:TetR/AcrR family transcriptional regulator n=1 Tax=Phycicoccus sp. CSK15P-2 TaxID=2807627 RepID=UPI00194FDD6E|nr:TetR family transcriptional regulator C-terminal domain-containing protein [Phycicoccus sp. CSK15P-2]MBM6405676.1 TetR family transcriptional regulator C-terminal domain-containing protein [Phycicoccus sp. CSK15P-2]